MSKMCVRSLENVHLADLMALLNRLKALPPRDTEKNCPMSAVDAVEGSSTGR